MVKPLSSEGLCQELARKWSEKKRKVFILLSSYMKKEKPQFLQIFVDKW